MRKINVLSLFGGIECGRVAIDSLGWNIGNYYSSEIDEYAKKITTENYPEIIHVGSVTKLKYDPVWKVLNTDSYIAPRVEKIDLLIGGSPCQDLSIAKAWGKGLEGEKSGLFYEYVRILQETKPAYFLLENVASMKKADKDKITEILGVDPIMINSNLLSAQNRKRLYWAGRWNGEKYETVKIEQPKDKGILLRDILEDIPLDDERWKPLPEKYITDDFSIRIREATKLWYIELMPWDCVDMGQENSKTRRGRLMRNKSNTLTTWNEFYTVTLAETRNRKDEPLRVFADQEKSPALRSAMGTGGGNVPIIVSEKAYPVTATYAGACPRDYLEKSQRQLILGLAHRNRGEGKAPECNGMEKANSLTTVQTDSEVLGVKENELVWRKLTPVECERLQTLPDNYTSSVSNSRRYRAIGNGWTVDVIAHILSYFTFDNH